VDPNPNPVDTHRQHHTQIANPSTRHLFSNLDHLAIRTQSANGIDVIQARTNGGAYRSDSTLSTSLLAFRQTEQDFEEQLCYHDFLSCPGSSKSSQCSQLKGNLCDHFRDTTIYTGSCNVCSRTSQREVAAAITLIKHKLNPSRE
jgi:hypothetical protein